MEWVNSILHSVNLGQVLKFFKILYSDEFKNFRYQWDSEQVLLTAAISLWCCVAFWYKLFPLIRALPMDLLSVDPGCKARQLWKKPINLKLHVSRQLFVIAISVLILIIISYSNLKSKTWKNNFPRNYKVEGKKTISYQQRINYSLLQICYKFTSENT